MDAGNFPKPVSAAAELARVSRADCALATLFAQRGFAFDEVRRTEGRRLFLKLLAPHAQAFLQRLPGNSFPALPLDRHLPDRVLTAFAARSGDGADALRHTRPGDVARHRTRAPRPPLYPKPSFFARINKSVGLGDPSFAMRFAR